MILYDNRSLSEVFLSRAGSVIFYSGVIIPAMLSTGICAWMMWYPGARQLAALSDPVARIYATILGFVIVFRTNLAFGRFFEGVTHVQGMFSKWRDAFVSLVVFIEASALEHKVRGGAGGAAVEEAREHEEALRLSKGKLLHWFSLLSAVAVQRLRHEEWGRADRQAAAARGEPVIGGERFVQRPVPVDRLGEVRLTQRLSQSADFHAFGPTPSLEELLLSAPEVGAGLLRETADEEFGGAVQVIGLVSPEEASQAAKAHDMVLVVVKWILLEVSALHHQGRLLIGPPILSRVYQELSNGMLAFFMAMKIATVPFPFPFAQFLQYALYAFLVFCPFAVLVILEDMADPRNEWLLLIMNYFACAGFFALNEIAVELEDPFGEDDNDYPVHSQQWNFVWALEDCYFSPIPTDFSLGAFGLDAKRLADDVQLRAAEQHLLASSEGADLGADDVSSEEMQNDAAALQAGLRLSVQALKAVGEERRSACGELEVRLRKALNHLVAADGSPRRLRAPLDADEPYKSAYGTECPSEREELLSPRVSEQAAPSEEEASSSSQAVRQRRVSKGIGVHSNAIAAARRAHTAELECDDVRKVVSADQAAEPPDHEEEERLNKLIWQHQAIKAGLRSALAAGRTQPQQGESSTGRSGDSPLRPVPIFEATDEFSATSYEEV